MAAKKLRIGFVFDDSLDRADGVSQYVRTVGSWLTNQGHDVSYIVGNTVMKQWEGGKVHSLSKNIAVKFNANRLTIPLLARKHDIKKVLENEFDVLHVQVPFSPLMAQRVIKHASQSTVVIGTFHILPAGRIQAYGSKILGLVQTRALRRFDSVVSVSPAAAEFARRYFSIKSIVIPNAVTISRFQVKSKNSYPKNSQKKRIVFLGRLVERKGARQLIEAFAALPKDLQKSTELLIASDGPLRAKLEQLVIEKKLIESVQFLGFIDEADKPQLLRSADVACFPSLYGESFGIVLIEAMAAGSGVVLGGDNPGYRSVLSLQSKLLVNPRDRVAFAHRLEELLTNSRLCSELHEWQMEHVKQYDVPNVGAKLVTIYEEALVKRRGNLHT